MGDSRSKGYSLRERWLLGLAIVFALCFGAALLAWKLQLVPYATDFGNVGEWVGALATLGGFGAAVYTLQKNASDARRHEEQHQRAEAARVAVAWDMDVEDLGFRQPSHSQDLEFLHLPQENFGPQRLWRHKARIRNSGSSPVTQTYIWLQNVKGPWTWEGRNSVVLCDTLLPGAERVVDFDIAWGPSVESTAGASKIALGEMTGFGFRDVHNQCWMYQDGKLRKVRSEEAYAMDA
ncbi:hypothetical protein [Arthrobacter sp. HMWF013]|uniref:hypothetical protein n=1 Tax=Arthrobacter sp. HMWF013 TaxID=2056849 RepID=UPI0011B26C5A|nr:hypothetical protein [Arthrobacter sp. HMWF013]